MGSLGQKYRALSPEDRRTFDRWLRANAAAGLILAAGLVAMAVMGSSSPERNEATRADRTKASEVGVPARDRGRDQDVTRQVRK
jgi:hypothetical protein